MRQRLVGVILMALAELFICHVAFAWTASSQTRTADTTKAVGAKPFTRYKAEEVAALAPFLKSDDLEKETIPASIEGQAAGSVDIGAVLFQRNCAFCHGKDTAGGESGPDLTRSKLVSDDIAGDKISVVVRNGRPDAVRKMPAFNFSSEEMLSLAAFIHAEQLKAEAKKGDRRGVDVSDFQTGDVAMGKAYFNGAGGCAKCHSETGDLAGVATRHQGLELEERMLFPKELLTAKMTLSGPDDGSPVTVTLRSGTRVKGTVAYRDEFVIGLRDENGEYRSWPTDRVKYVIVDRLKGHVDLLSRYTDNDIHNLMAYIQTLR